MQLAGQDMRAMAREQRLLRELVRVARRSDGLLPADVLDPLLAGTGAVRPALPVQRARSSS